VENEFFQNAVDTPAQAEPAAPGALDLSYADPALEQIRAAVKGNGINPASVTVKKLKGEVAEFGAAVSLILRTRTMEKIVGGKKTGGEKVEGPQGVRDGIEKERVRILGSFDTTTKIKDMVMERKDKGFGTRNEVIKLPFLTQEYVHHQACRTCGAQGEIKCQRCFGKGFESCPRCNGQSMEVCSQCRGAQLIFNGNQKIPCPKCNGQGRTPCMMCNQTRKIACNVCRTKGSTVCQNCNGHAWHSYITTAEVDVVGTYDFQREAVPARLLQTVETRAKEIPLYADITALATPTDPQTDTTKTSDEIPLKYHVRLPYAEADIAFGKVMNANAFLLGKQADIADIPAFLETLLKRGIETLKDAGEGRGDVADKIQRAGQYRTIRHAIIASARFSKGKAVKLVAKNTPLGISDVTINNLVINADKALKNITAKPRRNGVFVGAGIAAVLYLVYMIGLRAIAGAHIPNEMLLIATDGAVVALGMLFAVLTIQIFGAGAMKKALGKLLPADQKGTIMPKAGNSGLWSALLCIAMFLLAAEISVHANGSTPDWYTMAREKIVGASSVPASADQPAEQTPEQPAEQPAEESPAQPDIIP
jgi:hypothetical protein